MFRDFPPVDGGGAAAPVAVLVAVPIRSIAFDAVSFALSTRFVAPSTAPAAASFADLTKLSAPSVIEFESCSPVSFS